MQEPRIHALGPQTILSQSHICFMHCYVFCNSFNEFVDMWERDKYGVTAVGLSCLNVLPPLFQRQHRDSLTMTDNLPASRFVILGFAESSDA
jgi:hypothetical protein